MNQNHISLYYFTVVVEEMNISRAAKRLFIAQQSLSDHIKRLEKQYNTVLFERTPRLKLTYAGEKVLEYAKAVLEADEMLNYSISEYQTASKKKLNVGVASYRCNVFLPDLIDLYSIKHPNILISIYEGPTELLNSMLRSKTIDVYFSLQESTVAYGKSVELLPEESYFLVSRDLLKNKFGASWKDFLLNHKDGVYPNDIIQFPLILPSNFSPMRSILDKYFASFDCIPKIYFESSNDMATHLTCSRGHCGCISPMPFLYDNKFDYYADNPIFALPLKDFIGQASFNLIYEEASEQQADFYDFIESAKIATSKAAKLIEGNIASQFDMLS